VIEQESQEGDDNFAKKKTLLMYVIHMHHGHKIIVVLVSLTRLVHQVRWKNVHHGGHYSSSKDRKTEEKNYGMLEKDIGKLFL
jgi:hypothetical protein